MTEDDDLSYESVMEEAERSFRRHERSIRGQTLTERDTLAWHVWAVTALRCRAEVRKHRTDEMQQTTQWMSEVAAKKLKVKQMREALESVQWADRGYCPYCASAGWREGHHHLCKVGNALIGHDQPGSEKAPVTPQPPWPGELV